jgi:hypothetical protein
MNVTIDIVELASELAEKEIVENYSDSIEIYSDEDNDCIVYTDEAQNIFDTLYDKYYSLIDNLKLN